MTPHATPRRFWENRATALAWRINFAAWLARMAPTTFFIGTGFSVVVYALRRSEASLGPAWWALTGALVLAAIACWWRARREFYRPEEARVLLETQLRLDTRLTAAALGLVPWPAALRSSPAPVRWRLGLPAAWTAGAAALLALAVLSPVWRDANTARPAGPPPSLLQTEAMLTGLKDMNVAAPEALEKLEERARELARRAPEEQYSHSALEAADALRNQTVVSATSLARSLESAANALADANRTADLSGPADRLSAALSGLRDGALPASNQLLNRVPMSASELKNLTFDQRAALAQQLANAAKGIGGVCGAAGAGALIAEPDKNAVVAAGGPGGGGRSAPLALKSLASDAGLGNAEGLSSEALKRFSLGDKLGTSTSAHDVDPARSAGTASAGAIAQPASGGEAVWVNRLTPAERAAVKQFFK